MPCYLNDRITQSMSLKMLSTSCYLLKLPTPTQQKQVKTCGVFWTLWHAQFLIIYSQEDTSWIYISMQIKRWFPCTIYEPASVYSELISGCRFRHWSRVCTSLLYSSWPPDLPSSCSLKAQSVEYWGVVFLAIWFYL